MPQKNSMPFFRPDCAVKFTQYLTYPLVLLFVLVSWKSEAAFVSSSGDMAYDYGRATTELADGTVIMGSYLVVWTKENGEWKVAADIFN